MATFSSTFIIEVTLASDIELPILEVANGRRARAERILEGSGVLFAARPLRAYFIIATQSHISEIKYIMKNVATDPLSKLRFARLKPGFPGTTSCDSTFYIPSPPPEPTLLESESVIMPVFQDGVLQHRLEVPKKTWRNVDIKVMAKVRLNPRPSPDIYMKLLRNARRNSIS